MADPWIRYKRIPLFFGYKVWWPSSPRGWLFLLFLAVLWIGGGNAIALTILPSEPRKGWICIATLAVIGIALFQYVLRYKGEEV